MSERMSTGIYGLSIIVSSENSISFYEKLGFSVILKKERGYDTVVILEGLEIQLQLFIDPTHPDRATNPENKGLRLVAFEVQSIEEICAQFECGEIKTDWFGNRYCLTHDPDGLPIQLVERKFTC